MTVAPKSIAVSATLSTDTYSWAAPYGGAWATPANWMDTTLGAVAALAPGATNAVSINGGVGTFNNVTGNGSATSLAISNDVIVWGTLSIGGALTLAGVTDGSVVPDLDLDGAGLTTGNLSLGNGDLEAGNGSTLKVAGTALLNQGFLLSINGSAIQLGALVANSLYNSLTGPVAALIAVDDASSIEVGTKGGAAKGALTIDAGLTAVVCGAIDGNLLLNGTLAVQGGSSLTIPATSPFGTAQSISGAGALVISENSTVTLGLADSTTIQFAGPAGTLNAMALPSGKISGFAAGDVIEFVNPTSGGALSPSTATGLSYQQINSGTAALTLTKGGKSVGTLTLAGNYTGSLFHLSLNASGGDFITLQTIGSAPVQPGLINGTQGTDTLYATANGQTLTGLGGNDTLAVGGFTGVVLRDSSANLNGSTITAYGVSDVIDLTDMKSATAAVTLVPGGFSTTTLTILPAELTVTDGTHTATIALASTGTWGTGYFASRTDGVSGTDVQYVTINTDPLNFGTTTFATSTGGVFGVAADWQDTLTGNLSALAPGFGNAVTIAGGSAYADITGNGVAASLTTSGDVLLFGSLAVGSTQAGVSGALTQTGTLDLDGGAVLALLGQVSIAGLVEIGGGSTMTAAGGISFTAAGAALMAIGGSSAAFAVVPGAASGPDQGTASTIAVDATSGIELGSAGNAAKGALTIDTGVTATLFGAIEGNLVVNGTLLVGMGGALAIGGFGSVGASVSGGGTLQIGNTATLGLNGSDSAAILFTAVSASSVTTPETLTLNGSLPTGTITGFAKGDVITLGRTVTGFSYVQTSSAAGTLTLLNGTTNVGTLTLGGSFAAGQFLLTPSADARSTSITYLPAPSTTTGTQVGANGHTYDWTGKSGGAWSNPGNWIDTSTGATPTAAPGPDNAVIFPGSTGGLSATVIVSGSGAAASVVDGLETVFTGTLTVNGAFAVQGYQSETWLENAASLSVGTLDDDATLDITGRSNLVASGLTASSVIDGVLTITGGSTLRVLGGTSNILGGAIAVDGASSFEIGAAGGPAAGALTIDSTQTVSADVAGLIETNLVVNGALIVSYTTTTIEGFGGAVGSVSGAGTIDLQSGGLVLASADSAAIAFLAGSPTPSLELAGPLPTGTISGFGHADVIRVDQTVTGVSFSQTTGTQGTLTLKNGATTVGTLAFAGNFASSLFQVDVAAATGFATVSLQTPTGAAGTSAANTGKDAYAWAGASGGTWTTAANWLDTTTAATPSTSPGGGDPVSIAGSVVAGQYTTIGGNGAAASLAVAGGVLLTGQVSVAGQLAVAPGSGPTAILALTGGAKLTAASAAMTGRLEVGGASTVSISNLATLTAGSLLVLAGSSVQVGGLLGDGTGNVVVVDASSTLRIGNSASAAAGALTQAAGSTIALTGAVYGNVVANGTFAVAGGGGLFIDLNGTVASDPYGSAPTISGTGTLSLAENSVLGLGAADSAAIQFAGPNATLILAALPTGSMAGFTAGDQIQFDQTVTGLSYKQTTTAAGTLTLTNGTATVGSLKLTGSYGTGGAFHLDAGLSGATAVITWQTLGVAALQPTLIQGTAASDVLTATANGQIITGSGGGDTLSGAGLTGIDFKDLTANLNGSNIQGFATSDWLDFIDMTIATASVGYTGGVLSVTDGSHLANVGLSFATTPATGSFHVATDGNGGTKLTWS